MGRGAEGQVQNLTQQQLNQTNAMNQQLLGQQQSLGNLVLPQYQSILNNPGYSPADQAAITGQSQGALASAFDSLQQSAANRVARTGNSAGFSELTDDLARQKGIAEGNLAQQNQLNFSNTAYQRQMAALQGLSGLYGVDTNLLGRTLGIPSQLLGVQANAAKNNGGFFSTLGSSLGGTVGGLAGLFV
jgi:predicted alpha/beta hydrolase